MAAPGKSPVYICSAALNKLGADAIVSLSDSSRRAVICDRMWPVVRDAVLASRNWGVTFERATLVKDNDAPVFDYAARFRLPDDLFLLLSTDLPTGARHTIEGDFLVCDYDTVKILYIKDTPDSHTYGPLLTDALIASMAGEIAYAITGSQAVETSMKQEAASKLNNASTRESQQRSSVALQARTFIDVRR